MQSVKLFFFYVSCLILLNFSSFGQGMVTSVSPDSTGLGTTVTLQISGTNTQFTQGTTLLRHSFNNNALVASNIIVNNDSSMTATFTIPDTAMNVGLWDVHAGTAAPLNQGFLVTSQQVTVQGCVFLDFDQNCIFDPLETTNGFSQFSVLVQPGNVTVPVNAAGYYAATLPLGTYTATLTLQAPAWWLANFGVLSCGATDTLQISTSSPILISNRNFGVMANYHLLRGSIYVDTIANCVMDSTEPRVPMGYVLLSSPYSGAVVNSDGFFQLLVPLNVSASGNLQYFPFFPVDSIACPASGLIPISVSGSIPNNLDGLNFGLTYSDSCPKLSTHTFQGWSRPCFPSKTMVNVRNYTPFPAQNVSVNIFLDSLQTLTNVAVDGVNSAFSIISPNEIVVNLGTLGAFSLKTIVVNHEISCNATWGDTVRVGAFANYSPANCVDSTYSFSETFRTVTYSWDPNNKETNWPLGENIDANDELFYTINFQNTGNDTAFTITLVDTLPAGLDPLTLIPLGASHPYTVSMLGNNIFKFVFANILLPDSNVNEPESHGFVNFSVKQLPGNLPGTIIQNKAAIYFDFNAPVITNYTYNIIPLPVKLEEIQSSDGLVNVFPNPFNSVTRFSFSPELANSKLEISIMDLTGRLVHRATNISGNYYDFSAGQLAPQMYHYLVVSDARTVAKGKLIITK